MVRTVQLLKTRTLSVDQLSEFYKVEDLPTLTDVCDHDRWHCGPSRTWAARRIRNRSAALDDNPIGAGGLTDNRALQYGWATADAVLGGAGILRDNPAASWYPRDKDLQDLLTKRNRKPVRAVVTGEERSI